MSTFTLENASLRLRFDRESGALVSLTAVETGWKILDRPHLGLSFRLLLPLLAQRNNPVFGEKQKLTSLEIKDGRSAHMIWDGIRSEQGGLHPIKLTMEVSLTTRQALFTMTIENRSDLVVENVYCPYLGDVQHPANEDWFKSFSYQYATAQQFSIWPTFENNRGYFGVDYPTQWGRSSHSTGAPMTPFILLHSATQGLYAGIYSPSSELVTWNIELRPGYSSAIDSQAPVGPTIGGTDVATRFAAVHLPYVQPGESRTLTPIALEAFQGGWQQGVDIYKRWRSGWMSTPRIPQWALQPHSWLQFHINSPEDELRMRFSALPQIGEECARYGVKAIQLVGWNAGGQDRGNPSHDPDPKLGSFQELKDAIARIQALGVKVVLFAKFTWSDRASERFRNDLIRLAIKDPHGDYYQHPGYQYQTATQLLDVNTTRLIPMCFLSEDYLKVCEEEFQKTVDLGADGILFDECLHHTPALLCFDTSHGHRYAAPVYANDRELIHRFARHLPPHKQEFLFSGEACYDWEFDAYQLSYHRSWDKQHVPLSRYMLPEIPLMTAIIGFNDRHMINQCLMYRYIISYEPYNFKGRLRDFPLTMAYGQHMDALRSELRDYFWDGEFRDEVGAAVIANGQPHQPYAVFTNRQTGKCGLVIANYSDTETIVVAATLAGGQALKRYRLVDDPAWRLVANGITIPPASAAVII